jgi:NAD(P)-dependent dehydrogenase (short-subunit alcohol dehydrogenase family)
MTIVVVGASGTIGSAVVRALSSRHEVIRASRRGDVHVDLSDPASIKAMYESLSDLDAVVCTAGYAKFGKLETLSDDDFAFGLRSKLMGQINLVRFGHPYLNAGGSFALTSGMLARTPSPGSSMMAATSAAIEGFVRAAALELPRSIRINAISPPWVRETAEKLGLSVSALPAAQVARAYVEAIEGTQTGEILYPMPPGA